jgi:hypothetical protein
MYGAMIASETPSNMDWTYLGHNKPRRHAGHQTSCRATFSEVWCYRGCNTGSESAMRRTLGKASTDPSSVES